MMFRASTLSQTKSYICQTELQLTSINTVVIENMVDIKENETSNNLDTTIKCRNKIKNLRSKLEIKYDKHHNQRTEKEEMEKF